MMSVAIAEVRAVVVNKAPLSIPVTLKIAGLTARIYAIVKKVDSPAMISVRMVVFSGLKPRYFCKNWCMTKVRSKKQEKR